MSTTPRRRVVSSSSRGRGGSPSIIPAGTPTRPAGNLRSPAASAVPKSPVSRTTLRPKVTAPAMAEPEPTSKPISIKEQIALKRAEAMKKATSSRSTPDKEHENDVVVEVEAATPREEDILGRWTIRESVDRARSSGSLNLATRELSRIPSYLFEAHLTITPAPLKDAPPEVVEPEVPSKLKKGNATWYEQADLTILKMWDNMIVEIQPELSLFGSLKVVDLHKNKLKRLPDSFVDLVFLTNLDISENELESLPSDLSSLPLLTTLNVSHNQLSSLHFQVQAKRVTKTSSSFFAPIQERATKPLPALKVLLASHNKLTAGGIQHQHLPQNITEADFSNNELGSSAPLLQALGQLPYLRTLRLKSCGLQDGSFPSVNTNSFSRLSLFNLAENHDLSEAAIRGSINGRQLDIGSSENLSDGRVRVVIGTQGPMKENWEIEADLRSKKGKGSEPVEEEFVIGGPSKFSQPAKPPTRQPKPVEKAKEAWELDADMGMLTEGGRRRARMAAATAAAATTTKTPPSQSNAALPTSPTREREGAGSPIDSKTPSLVQFYDGPHSTLTLPRSQPQVRSHARNFSVAVANSTANVGDLVVPAPTLPLPTILAQSFTNSIRTLVLSFRRMDVSFIIPSSGISASLPNLDELCLDNCNLSTTVSIVTEGSIGGATKEPLLDTIAGLFPSIGTLDLSYNSISTLSGVGSLFTPDPSKKRKGLKVLRVRGNKLSSLEPLEEIATLWKSSGTIEGWRGEEIDLRDNEISRLPPMLGLLPLDVLLVEGNIFRVPARRVWEKDGSKGLLKWLADRI